MSTVVPKDFRGDEAVAVGAEARVQRAIGVVPRHRENGVGHGVSPTPYRHQRVSNDDDLPVRLDREVVGIGGELLVEGGHDLAARAEGGIEAAVSVVTSDGKIIEPPPRRDDLAVRLDLNREGISTRPLDVRPQGGKAGQDDPATAERWVEVPRGEQEPVLERIGPRAELMALAGVACRANQGEEAH